MQVFARTMLAQSDAYGSRLVSIQTSGCDGTMAPHCDHSPFDFALLVGQCLVSFVFLAVASIRLRQLWRAKPVTLPSPVIYLKLGTCLALCVLQILLLVQWIHIDDGSLSGSWSIGSAATTLVATVVLMLLTHQEQRRSITPSTTITVYLLASMLLDSLRCRKLWLIDNATTNTVVVYLAASIAVRLVILWLENRNKKPILIDDSNSYGCEASSGLISRSVLFWATDFLRQGHKSALAPSDLYELRRNLQSKRLLHRMTQHWNTYKNSGSRALLWNLFTSCRATILIAAVPRIGQAACKVAEPFLVSRVITYVQRQGMPEAEPLSAGYDLVVAVTLVCVLRRISDNFYDQSKLSIQVAVRGSLVSTLLHHATLLEPSAKEGSDVLTLMTNDVSRIVASIEGIHEFWVIPVEVVIAAWLLARQVGVGAVGPAIAFAISFTIGGYFSRFMGSAQRQWSESVQRRVGDTTMILGSMKETKMLGLSEFWETKIQGLMENQIIKSRLFRGLFLLVNTAAYLPNRLTSTITFGIALLLGNGSLDLATAFTSLSIMQLVLGPLAFLTSSAPFLFSAIASAERIQEFITLSEKNEESITKPSQAQEPLRMPTVSNSPILEARDAAVLAKWSEEPTIKNMNFVVKPGSFTLIAGKVGSGKTVLIRAMLGQLPCSHALLQQAVDIAYCAQTTWLVNATARENILGQSTWDETWYNTVVSACALDRDFQETAGGDSALVGSKGQSLSGGQKQRISLARAVYSREKVVIIDDVLSGLDWETQRHVWKHVFSEERGLLRRDGITLVLATHALHLVKKPDSVILLRDAAFGDLVQGTLDELKATTNIQQLISSNQEEEQNEEQQQHADPEATSNSEPTNKATPAAENDDEKNDISRKTGDLPLYKFYFEAVGWVRIAHFVFAFLVFAVLLILPDIWLKIWSEANSSPKSVVNTVFYFTVFAILGIASLITTSYVIAVVLLDLSPSGTRNIHTRLLATVMRAPLSFFTTTDTGDLINRFTRDLMQVDLSLPLQVFFLSRGLGICLSSTALVISGSYYMVIVILPMFVFVYYVQDFYLRTSRQLRFLDLEATAPLYNHFIETVDGAATIQAFGWESAISAKGLALLDEAQKPYYMLRIIQIWLEVVVGLFVAAMTAMLVLFCVSIPSSTSAGAVALAFTHVLTLGGMLAELVRSWTGMETPLGSVERIKLFESNTPREKEASDPQIVEASWPSAGRLELKSVTASYKSSGSGTPVKALNGVTVTIKPGQKVGICGRTGSGKSSLLLTLFKLLDLDAGSIFLDGVDVASIPNNLLRSRLIAIPQEPKIFSGTLRSNLQHSNDDGKLNDEYLIDALKRVELWDHVNAKGGLDSAVEDLGLSQGQKQLALLARALVHRDTSRVLIMDEAMSAVDKVTEEIMVKVIKEDFIRHTVISVVHRLHTVLEFDTVVLLGRGVVVEAGPPGELLQKKGGQFRALWKGTGDDGNE